MHEVIPDIEPYVIELLISVAFAFLIGLEIYTKTEKELRQYLFGSERTLSFIALLGFILLKSDSLVPYIYIAGFAAIALFFLVYYLYKIKTEQHYGITIILLGLLVYTFPLIIEQFPFWFSMLIIVLVMVLVEKKTQIKEFAEKIYADDFITVAKFVFLSCVILPLVPDKEIIPGLPVSPYKLWLAIVAISAISYLSYLLKKFVFPKAGLLLTGILGGLYSSTATTFILARKSKEATEAPSHYAAAIIAATALMFLRIYILIVIFNPALSMHVLPYFAILTVMSFLVAFIIYRMAPNAENKIAQEGVAKQNPLELRVALIFGLLYIVFSLLTKYTLQYYGHGGLNVLSFIVGFTDIDPFLLNLFQGKTADITLAVISMATLQAIISNNILKMIYAVILGDKTIRKYVLLGFGTIIIGNIAILFFI